MKTFDEILKERQSSYQDINNEVDNAQYDKKEYQKTIVKLAESSPTDKPDLTPYFNANEQQIHDKVNDKVSKLISKMIKDGNNDYREIVKILESTIALISLINEFDIQILNPKYKKNTDITSHIMGMTPEEYNVMINKELNY
jgi:hypothetical protein